MNIQILGILILFIIGGIFLVSHYNSSREVLGYFCTKISNATAQNNQFSFGDESCGIQSSNIEPNQYGEDGVAIEGAMYRLNLEFSCNSFENKVRIQNNASEGAKLYQNVNGTVYFCTGFNAGT